MRTAKQMVPSAPTATNAEAYIAMEDGEVLCH
jgi:hypothetical protein